MNTNGVVLNSQFLQGTKLILPHNQKTSKSIVAGFIDSAHLFVGETGGGGELLE